MTTQLSPLKHLGSWSDILGDPHVAAYDGIATNGDTPEYGAVAIHDNIVLKYGMAVNALDGVALSIQRETLGTEGYALV